MKAYKIPYPLISNLYYIYYICGLNFGEICLFLLFFDKNIYIFNIQNLKKIFNLWNFEIE